MSPLQGKTVIVTGSGAGLGQVIAKHYLEAGANVVICDIAPDRVQSTVAALEPSHLGRVHAATVDVTSEDSVAALFASAVSKFNRVDILVNNAGVMDTFDGVATLPKSTWDRVMGVNATGPYLASKAAVNLFLRQGADVGGVIINIDSTAGFRGTASGAAYTASKHALLGLTKHTAACYSARGVYTMALCLGAMSSTSMAKSVAPEDFNGEGYGLMLATLPGFDSVKTSLKLEDVAKYCLFLSDRSIAESSNGSCIVFNKNWPVA